MAVAAEYYGRLPRDCDGWPLTYSEIVNRNGNLCRREVRSCPEGGDWEVALLTPLPSKLQGGRGFLRLAGLDTHDFVTAA